MTPRILLIEDEPGIRVALSDELAFEGFDVEMAEDGAEGLAAILRSPPDLIVLDLMLPGHNGFAICERVRQRGITTPIIMLTARNQEVDKIRGLGLGADDYLTKPFSLAELVARIRAVLRRTSKEPVSRHESQLLHAGAISLDLRKHDAFKAGVPLQLTDTEFRMLALLLRRPGDAITRDEFLKEIWGDDVYVTHRSVDTHIASLRKKIEDDLDRPTYIVSVRNVGYRLNETLTRS